MKTVKEWFEEQGEPVRTILLENMTFVTQEARNIWSAINSGFMWVKSPQKDVWSVVFHSKTFTPLLDWIKQNRPELLHKEGRYFICGENITTYTYEEAIEKANKSAMGGTILKVVATFEVIKEVKITEE